MSNMSRAVTAQRAFSGMRPALIEMLEGLAQSHQTALNKNGKQAEGLPASWLPERDSEKTRWKRRDDRRQRVVRRATSLCAASRCSNQSSEGSCHLVLAVSAGVNASVASVRFSTALQVADTSQHLANRNDPQK